MTTVLNPRGALGVGIGVIAGWASAAIFSFALSHADSMLVVFAYLAAVPLFVAGFSAGAISVLTATLSGVVGLALSVSPSVAFSFGLVNALPVLLVCLLALRSRIGADGKTYWYPEGMLTTGLVLYPCLAFLVVALMMNNQEGGLLGASTTMILTGIDQVSEGMEAEIVAQIKNTAPSLARFLPGVFGLCWSFLVIGSAYSAQTLLQKERWNIRDNFAWVGFSIPTALIVAVAATGVTAFLAPDPYGYVALNLCLMLCLPLFLAGLAVTHLFAATRKYKVTFLVLFYVLLSFVPWLVILIALLGALDQAFSLKERLAKTSKQV